MDYYPFGFKLVPVLPQIRVRLSIFIIIGACAGLPALVWSVSDLIHHRNKGHRVSAFIILLLLTDIFELLLSPYILVKLLVVHLSWHDWLDCFFFYSWPLRACSLLLNQLVALEGILSVKYPLYTASVFSSPCFIIFYILVFLCIIIGEIFLYNYYLLDVQFVFIVSVITWIIFSCISCCASRHSPASRKPDHHIWVVFIFTLLVLYLPFISLCFFLFFNPSFHQPLPVWLTPCFLLSVRLISDPLLCVLVCRQNLSIQTSKNPEGTSLV